MRGDNQVTYTLALQVGVDLRKNLTVARPERLELRLHLVADESACICNEFHLLHVQLVRDDGNKHRGELCALHIHRGKRLAVLYVRSVARCAAEHHNLERLSHVRFEFRVDHGLVYGREIAKMHAFGRGSVHGAHEVLVDLFRHERGERRGKERHRLQNGEERHVGGFLVCRHLLAPIALAAAAHIPVGKLVREGGKRASGLGDVKRSKGFVHGIHERVQAGKHPFVHRREGFFPEGMFCWVKPVDVRIQDIERIGVPKRAHKLALCLGNGFRRETAREPRHGAGIEIPAHGVGALIVKHRPRINHIALVLAHLEAILVAHKAKHDTVLKARLVEQAGGDRKQGIKPAACLVERFADEVRGIAALELLLVFKRIVPLRKGH